MILLSLAAYLSLERETVIGALWSMIKSADLELKPVDGGVYAKFQSNPKYIEDILVGNRFYCSCPEEFNDPFELTPQLKPDVDELIESLSKTEGGYEVYKRRVQLTGNVEKYTRQKFKKHLGRTVGKVVDDAIRANPIQFRKEFSKFFRIFSVTKPLSIANPLLWSYYANSHQGVVVELDFSDLSLKYNWLELYEIIYQDLMPEFPFPLGKYSDQQVASLVKVIATRKYKQWWQEDEVRVLVDKKHLQQSSFVYFKPSALRRIILGCRVQDEVKAVVRKALGNGIIKPDQIFSAIPKRDEYLIEVLSTPRAL